MKILYFLFFVTSLTFAQCDLGNNGMGTFESSADISKWFYSGQGQGTVEEEYSEVHEGNTSMKAWQIFLVHGRFGLKPTLAALVLMLVKLIFLVFG